MTILSVVQEAATELGMNVPSQLFGVTTREMVEMRAVVNEMARDIAEAHDWQKLRIIKTVTGDDVSEAFTLPTDYDRMLKSASLWSSRWLWAIEHVVDADEWIENQVVTVTNITGRWIIYGNELHILPMMASTETVKFFYISNLLVTADDLQTKPLFTADSDTFRLSERLLKLAIVAKWKLKKGQAYEQAGDDYITLRSDLIDKDQGSKPILSGRGPVSWKGRNIAWPGSVTGLP